MPRIIKNSQNVTIREEYFKVHLIAEFIDGMVHFHHSKPPWTIDGFWIWRQIQGLG